MNIKEAQGSQQGQFISFKAVLAQKKLENKSNGGNFLNLTFCDSSGRITTPVFDEAEDKFNKIEEGKPYLVKGSINIWNGNTQIKNINMWPLKEDEYTPSEFIASYEVPKSLEHFMEETVGKMSEPWRTLSMAAIGYNNPSNLQEFMTCPSAEKYHGNKLGGLFLHTLGVMSHCVNAIKLYEKLPMYGDINAVINKDRLIFKSIMHDMMKVKEYEYNTFIRRKPNVVGHLYDGVAYLMTLNGHCGNVLSEEELENIKTSILSHHGQYGPMEPKTTEDIILHLADMLDSRIVGELEKNNK